MEDILYYLSDNQQQIYVFILAVFVGVEVISKVPTVLHTPLMSGSNALSGVVIVGSIIVLGNTAPSNYMGLILGFLAVFLATLNVVGGFMVTNRMLEMFKKKPAKKQQS
ncbi:MAG: NAD(P) transhydrogenase subunit alpha [Anditalea sp.]